MCLKLNSEFCCQSHVRENRSTEVFWLKFSRVYRNTCSFKIESLGPCARVPPPLTAPLLLSPSGPCISQASCTLPRRVGVSLYSLFRHWFGRRYDVRFHFTFIMFLSRNIIVIQVLFLFFLKKTSPILSDAVIEIPWFVFKLVKKNSYKNTAENIYPNY